MKRTRLPLMSLAVPAVAGAFLLSVGCQPAADDPMVDEPPADLATSTPPPPDAAVRPETCAARITTTLSAPLIDVRSADPLAIDVQLADPGSPTAPHPVQVLLTTADGMLLRTLFAGSRAPGPVPISFVPTQAGDGPVAPADLPTGALRVVAKAECPAGLAGDGGRSEATLYLVRLGATAITIGDGEGGGRVPLMYHAIDRKSGASYPIPRAAAAASMDVPMGEPDLDQPDGSPRRFADKVWADLVSPPVDARGAVIETGRTLPMSLVVGTRPDVIFAIGKTARGAQGPQPTGLGSAGLPPIRLVIDGVAGDDHALVSEGGQVTVRLDPTPVPSIDRYDRDLHWGFEWRASDGMYRRVIGGDGVAAMRFYGVLGNDQGMTAPDLPWVAVVDEATRTIAGATRDPEQARAILVKHIYEEMSLTYDRKAGASHYTRYSGGGWTNATFSLTDFLLRSRGNVVNCSDCASILATYASMIGAKSRYAIIGWNFKLNPIQGIGAMMFGSPFDSGRLGFSYHAVTSPDSTMTVDDATLAVDGDADPTMAPHSKMLVQHLTGSDYMSRLSPTTMGTGTPLYQYKDQVTHAR